MKKRGYKVKGREGRRKEKKKTKKREDFIGKILCYT